VGGFLLGYFGRWALGVFTALKSDVDVTITSGKWLVFTPAMSQPTTGFIIYPGGRVRPFCSLFVQAKQGE
jgi:hypothetical protein